MGGRLALWCHSEGGLALALVSDDWGDCRWRVRRRAVVVVGIGIRTSPLALGLAPEQLFVYLLHGRGDLVFLPSQHGGVPLRK